MPRGERAIIAPSLLSADFLNLQQELDSVVAAGADWLHFDVMDGRFVPNISVGIPILEAVRRHGALPIDVHLMIVEPERWVETFAAAGADVLTVHLEACTHLHRCLQQIRACGMRAGVSLNPHSPIEALEWVLDELDMVLLMSVNPGFGGQRFIPSVLPKIRALRALAQRRGVALDIEVDGGLGPKNVAQVAQAGANVFVAGSAIFGQPDYAQVIAAMRAEVSPLVPRR
ncbi:MAG: ribulose-phosphate 3-epimerase [Myxococcota bacterium]|nr:ribulose-phosphate 3-epimerase [Myxococcota bacterium]